MDSHFEQAVDLDEQGEVAVTQVIERLRRVGAGRGDAGQLLGDLADDELLDQFWRRRADIGHC